MKKRIEPGSPPHRKARADARMFDTDRDLAPALPPPWPWQQVRAGAVDDIAMHDLGLLMDAVKARLRQLVEPNPAAPADQGLALCVRSGVVDCVDALGHLQAMTLQALGRYRQAELDALDAQADGLHASSAAASAPDPARLAPHGRLAALQNGRHDGRYFRDRLAQALAQAEPPHGTPLALIWLDVDGFQAISDAHGTNVGNALLQIVGARLQRAVRVHDTVGRVDDDAFGCLLHGAISPQQLDRLASKLSRAVQEPMQIGALSLTVRARVGLASCPVGAEGADAWLQCARNGRWQPNGPVPAAAQSDMPLPCGTGPRGGALPDALPDAQPDVLPEAAVDTARYRGDESAGRHGGEVRAAD